MKLAPIVLFVYKRLDCLKQAVEALKNNFHAQESDLIIFSDGSKGDYDLAQVRAVREYIKKISGFASVTNHLSVKNFGLATSVRRGVTQVLQSYDRVIVLEDDLITSTNFLSFMNASLERFAENKAVYSVSGYTFDIPGIASYPFDNYFHCRSSSWGWATWRSRWNNVDWELLKGDISNGSSTRDMGSDFRHLIDKFRESSIDSWAVPWTYFGFRNNMLTVFPTLSKVQNVGFDVHATHTNGTKGRYATQLDTSDATEFRFNDQVEPNQYYTRHNQFKFSYYERAKWKIRAGLNKFGFCW
jgi:glycosyltransferase involved in cell wall biosynthesis